MWRRFFPVVVAVCLLFGSLARAQNVFNVNEAETRAFFAANRLQAHLVLDNKAADFAARVKLEILDTDERVVAVKETFETIGRGRNVVKISLDLGGERDEKNLLWNRLRYTISPPNDAQNVAAGIVSLSEIMPEIFELRASAAENVRAGMNYRVRVRAFHPVTNLPTAAVQINAELEFQIITKSDDDELKITAAGKTDSEGYAILDFKIPANARLEDDADLRISGEKNGVVREADEDIYALEPQNYVYLNTDKPIYQPNQNFHARGLAMRRDAGGNVVNARQELQFIIEDEDDTALYRETVKTSRFGVASVGWKIPDGAKLGTYRIRVKDADGEQIGYQNFKVSRYELPNFTVTAKSDKTFYLPGENTAEIVVSAEYLFGKAVTKGAVRVVRETERRWSYANQKYEIDEAETLTGEADGAGKFTTKVDLTKAHESLKDSGYRRFEDLRFAAYFTDATTNRTEQRRFDVRVSKEAIHVYLIDVDSYDEHNPKLPVSFYVSTFYADGAPAACDVEARGKYEGESDARTQTLTRLKTNRFGAGKVEFTPPRADSDGKTDLKMKIVASDKDKKTGTQEEEIDIDANEKELQIRTAKTIYRVGEAINAELFFSEPEADVFVDVAQNMSVVASRLVKIKNGRASLSIPYKANFAGELTLAAYIDDEKETVKDAKGIIYPQPNELKLGVSSSKTVYRPNEEATLDFTVAAPGRTQSEAALGVVVFDKAIEERARTDAEFGGAGFDALGNYTAFLSGGKSFGGVTISMINEMDTRQKISPELQLAAEVMLANADYFPNFFESDYYGANLKSKFENYFLRHSVPVQTVLRNAYNKDFTHATNASALQKILLESGVDFTDLRDPWGNRYRADFTIERDENVVSIRSAGANETFDNKDDVLVLQMKFKYFVAVGNAINRAVANYQARTGAFIQDYATLENELKKENVDLDKLRDRWNRPYAINFGASGRFYTIDVQSFGADGKTDGHLYDDFTVWTNRADYFADAEAKMQAVLSNYASASKTFPQTENEFKEILRNGGVDFGALRDGWNRPLYLEIVETSRYTDKIKTEVVGTYGGGKPSEKLTITPVTQRLAVVRVRSAGADLIKSNYDDFDLTTFSGVISEQSKADAKPIELKTETIFTGGKGAVRGTITDANGAVIPNATITATNEETNAVVSVASNDEGVFLLANLPSGKYTIQAEAVGFKVSVVQNVPVQSSTISILNIEMEVGVASQVVEVTADAVQMNMTTNASIVTTRQIENLPINGRRASSLALLKPGVADAKNKKVVTLLEETATPRLREYFPETLLWNPELVTDKNGRASVKFNLADSLTTWKLYAVGSNADGKIGVASGEIKTFQPFFVDLEPPKFLTVGDEIGLPVQIRNYTEKAQRVGVTMASGDWFSLLNAANQTIDVLPNESENAIFNFRVNTVVKAGKQRVTAKAAAAADADAIEKTVAVRPNGKEIVQTQSDIFRESVAFDANFPANALPKTQSATVKIYPNLMAHVAESIEGLLQRPYGCGEQTISSTYPNLMILKAAAKSKNAPPAKLQEKAEKYLRGGYERLVGYQVAGGGFSYWGSKDAPDIALTAYAIRFLTDAQNFTEVDESVIEKARKWLVSQQRADGSWTKMYYGETVEDRRRVKIFTTYIARVLALTEKDKKEKSKDASIALQKAFDYLKKRSAEIDEPFALASFALALFDAGETDAARLIAAKLETMAIAENGGAYWNLETNTPFYGWGAAGRIETTALVVQALEKAKGERIKDKVKAKTEDQKPKTDNQKTKTENQNSETDNKKTKTEDLIAKGTLFLLKNKDRYGVWYSTQASVNVLDAILAVVAGGETENVSVRTAEIFVNGQKAQDVKLPDANELAAPLEVDLAAHLAAGDNRVEVKIGGNQSAAMAQIVVTHYVSWKDFTASGRDANQSRQLRLDYDCDKKSAAIMQEVNCRVRAERVGFRGYGMLLAEIGLPPGADVDRASLEKAKEANWSFSRYDVLPDKIIIYMWAQAGGTQIDFKFKPRYGIAAQTAPSIVYDYYNAEAQAVVAPLRFSVK